MAYKKIPISDLIVNPANDRHGELENETAAIAQLFATQELHMRNLAKDIATNKDVFEPPLVYPDGNKFIVADGNRRTTCLKLLSSPRRAPTPELQKFFSDLRQNWGDSFPDKIECRVESDRDRVDDILYRRHTGVQGGIGQSNWNDRMKKNFVVRTGKSKSLHLADEIEKRLKTANLLPTKKIPRSNMNRLLSSEALRNRVGISVRKDKLEFIRDENTSLEALSRIATDLANKTKTLEDIWSTTSKLKYLDELDAEGILPTVHDVVTSESSSQKTSSSTSTDASKSVSRKPKPWPHIITEAEHGISWSARTHRHQEIWEELQYKLLLSDHPNAISVLLRVLLELSIENYIKQSKVTSAHPNDKLSNKAAKVAAHMEEKGLIDKKYLGDIKKLQQGEALISTDTLNRYVHSSNFRVSPEHLKSLWGTLEEFIINCLKA